MSFLAIGYITITIVTVIQINILALKVLRILMLDYYLEKVIAVMQNRSIDFKVFIPTATQICPV